MSTLTEAPTRTPETSDPDAPRARYAVLDGRSCKALALACSDETSRPLLNFARLRRDATFEACNGHLLVRMRPTLCDSEGRPTDDRMYHAKGWLVHRTDLKRLKVAQSLRLDLETGELVVLDREGEPELAIPGGASTEEAEGGAYPDTDRVYRPEHRPECLRFRLAARYLKRLAKLAEAVGEDAVTLEVPENDHRGALHGIRYVTGSTEGLVMPMRLDG